MVGKKAGGAKPLKLNIFSFCTCNGICKFACFLIFGNGKKITDICVALQKIAFNNHNLACVCLPEGT